MARGEAQGSWIRRGCEMAKSGGVVEGGSSGGDGDVDGAGSGAEEGARGGVGGGAGGEDVVDQEDSASAQLGCGEAGCEGVGDVLEAFATWSEGLGTAQEASTEGVREIGPSDSTRDRAGEEVGLVESAAEAAEGVEGNGDDEVDAGIEAAVTNGLA